MTGKRILVLDDHRAILEIVIEALRYAAYEAAGISFGFELLPTVRWFQPDLILLDYKLADANGGELCARLKRDPSYRYLPVIIFSAYFNPADYVKPGGCDDVLYKPFDLENLLSAVHRNLNIHAMAP
jgi:CheY-like chemotaxis protein